MIKKSDVTWFLASCKNKALTTTVNKSEKEFIKLAIDLGVFDEFINELECFAQYILQNNTHKEPRTRRLTE